MDKLSILMVALTIIIAIVSFELTNSVIAASVIGLGSLYLQTKLADLIGGIKNV